MPLPSGLEVNGNLPLGNSLESPIEDSDVTNREIAKVKHNIKTEKVKIKKKRE